MKARTKIPKLPRRTLDIFFSQIRLRRHIIPLCSNLLWVCRSVVINNERGKDSSVCWSQFCTIYNTSQNFSYITFPVTFAFSGKKPSSTMHLFIKVVVSYNFLRFVVPKRKTEQIIECFFLVHTWLL
jgi:hypothetical protein